MSEEDKIIQERQKKFVKLVKNNPLFSIFLVILLFSLILSIYSLVSTNHLNTLYSLLFVASLISLSLTYYNKQNLSFYPVLLWLAYFAYWIRTLNIPGLKDITTNDYTLGPDLDPFLFLRWAKHIIANGSLMVVDSMRYVPIGFDTRAELILHPYLIAWFHKVAVLFGSPSVTYSAIIYPAIMFALTVIVFFFFTRKVFVDSLGKTNSNVIALISSFFLIVIPSLLPRTIAGIPEKEASGFFFLFLSFYLFLSAWKADKNWKRYSFAILSGITTAMMGLVWGGFIFIFITISLAVFFAFIFNQITKQRAIIFALWLIPALIVLNIFSTRYAILGMIQSTIGGIPVAILGLLIIHLIITETKAKKYFDKKSLEKIPSPIISLILFAIIGVIAALILFGPSFFVDKFSDLTKPLIEPITDRLGVTVAENRQPYFNEWASSFGPYLGSIPILFWLFFIGAVYLFNFMINSFGKKERIITTIAFVIFLITIIFSRYNSNSILNGTNAASILFYMFGVLALVGTFGYYYYQYHKNKDLDKLKTIDFGVIFLFAFLFFSIVSARGAVRLIMVLVPTVSILVSYLIVSLFNKTTDLPKDSSSKNFAWIALIVVVVLSVYSAYYFYNVSEDTARSYVPGIYNQQWQKAMSWVRESTPQDAVFAHWWDYGYWVQSIGERATVLDGGNAIPYWNHLMGRHALTGYSNGPALEYLYTHNATHLLIDSTDIGKYSAFSSIGSDENYDRASWIPTFVRDDSQTQETKTSIMMVYSGGSGLDSDLIYYQNGTRIFLPAQRSGLAGIVIEVNASGHLVSQPEGVFVDQKQQYRIPLRYAFDDNFHDYGSGVESGIYLMPRVDQTATGITIQRNGALLFFSNRTVNSQLARLYIYNSNDPNFKLVHSEDDLIVSELKAQSAIKSTDAFVYYQGVRGPIRIWEINYPSDIKSNPLYLQIDYPNSELNKVR